MCVCVSDCTVLLGDLAVDVNVLSRPSNDENAPLLVHSFSNTAAVPSHSIHCDDDRKNLQCWSPPSSLLPPSFLTAQTTLARPLLSFQHLLLMASTCILPQRCVLIVVVLCFFARLCDNKANPLLRVDTLVQFFPFLCVCFVFFISVIRDFLYVFLVSANRPFIFVVIPTFFCFAFSSVDVSISCFFYIMN